MLNRELLASLFTCDFSLGNLYIKETSVGKRGGTEVGVSANNYGYRRVKIRNISIMAHRVVWMLAYGDIPDGLDVDHINGIRSDNRLCNLRLATHSDNGKNRRMMTNNTSGFKGVSFITRDKRYRAQIGVSVGGKYLLLNLGTYDDPVEAAIAYDREAVKLYGPFAKTNRMLGLLA